MKRNALRRLILVAVLGLVLVSLTHGVGASFTYFFPRNGSFAHPIAPLSLSDIGVSFGKYVGVAASVSLLRISGLGITDTSGVPIGESPVLGPLTTARGSLYLKVMVPFWRITISAAGGGFLFYSFLPRLLEGNLDRLIASMEGHSTVTSDLGFTNSLGYGYTFGGAIKVMVTDQVGIKAGAMYYIGRAPLAFSGSYTHANATTPATTSSTLPAVLQNVFVDFRGIEISIGADVSL